MTWWKGIPCMTLDASCSMTFWANRRSTKIRTLEYSMLLLLYILRDCLKMISLNVLAQMDTIPTVRAIDYFFPQTHGPWHHLSPGTSGFGSQPCVSHRWHATEMSFFFKYVFTFLRDMKARSILVEKVNDFLIWFQDFSQTCYIFFNHLWKFQDVDHSHLLLAKLSESTLDEVSPVDWDSLQPWGIPNPWQLESFQT